MKLLKAFNCRFRAGEFQFLSQTIKIFPLLMRGRKSLDEKSIFKWKADEEFSEEEANFKEELTRTVEEIFVAIISRVAHGDELQEVKLNENAPKLAKNISLLDINWAE